MPPRGLTIAATTVHAARGWGRHGHRGCLLTPSVLRGVVRTVWVLLVPSGLGKVRVSEEQVWVAGLVDSCPEVCLENYTSSPF